MSGYEKYLGPEDRLHISCLRWLTLQYPHLVWHHSPNEGKRSKFEQYKFKMLGGKAGFPDLIIFNRFSGGIIAGLVVEFKVKPNKTIQAQKEWLSDLDKAGFLCRVVYTFEEFEEVVTKCYGYYKEQTEIHRKFNKK